MDQDSESRSRAPCAGGRQRRRGRSPGVPGAVLEQTLLDALGRTATPLSAYALVSNLRDLGCYVPVVSVYRALDRLIERDLIQKVETLSAYRVRDKAAGVLLVCTHCGRTTSLSMPSEYGNIVHGLPTEDFDLQRLAIEAAGQCALCRSPSDGPDAPYPAKPSPAARNR